MPNTEIPGMGRKRPQLDLLIVQLHLDGENPRLPEEAQDKNEAELLAVLYKEFYLDELADSMAKNGYFDEEPLVAIPRKLPKKLQNSDYNSDDFFAFINAENTEFTVVEGNRRLATAKLLLDPELREALRIKTWPSISAEVADDLGSLPVIVYSKRSQVVPYLGVRHIVGIQKWDSYAKARYIAKMIEDGSTIQQTEEQMGGQGDITKYYVCYKLLEQAENEFDLDTRRAKSDFSLLLLAIGQRNLKQFLSLPKRISDINFDEPVPPDYLPNLNALMTWIFGDGKQDPVIRDSRDITNFLSHIVTSAEAIDYLEKTRDLAGAFDRTDGEEIMLLKYLATANSRLESALGIAHRHKIPEVVAEVEKCEKTVKALLKTVREPND